tara:strand:- start:96 stop:533 length:438 start_codon:yes stop_codon:yes gene_type:complete
MTKAFNIISSAYTHDELLAINSYSGNDLGTIATSHSTYEQTLPFFEENEAEINKMIGEICGYQFMGELMEEHRGCYDAYRHDMVHEYIRLVATEVCAEYDRIEWEQDQEIESYMTLDQAADGLMNLSAVTYNAPGSMNDNRYKHL